MFTTQMLAGLLSIVCVTPPPPLPAPTVTPATPCSRILWNDNGRSVIVGRNMDWFEDIRSNLWVLPRGMQRSGLAQVNPLLWTSKYGSVVITAYDVGTADGINEKGLAGHLLFLPNNPYES